MKASLEEYFKAGTGAVPSSLEAFLGEKGRVAQLLGQYFNPKGEGSRH